MRISRVVANLLVAGTLFLAAGGRAAETDGQALLAELGCANCHSTLNDKSSLRERTVDLSTAGLRYNPAYLLQYLQNPGKVRHHLGRARMPDFRFSEKEAFALVQFLRIQTNISGRWPELPMEVSGQFSQPASRPGRDEFLKTLSGGLLCLTCHQFEGKGGAIGVELAEIGSRLQVQGIKSYLVSPAMFGVPAAAMPPQFYSHNGQKFTELTPAAGRKIQVVADFLFNLGEEKRKQLEEQYRSAESKYSDVSVSIGQAIFEAENCAACHRHYSITPRTNAAPDLARESERVRGPWLTSFLRKPTAIRPFGFHPGDGSRMPDFRLSDEEARNISVALLTNSPPTKSVAVTNLSAFSRAKAHALLNDKVACLGCHRFGSTGGRIGPDLSIASNRLQPAYLFDMIRDPHRLHRDMLMPKLPLSEPAIQLIGTFILQEGQSSSSSEYLSLVDSRITQFGTQLQSSTGRMNYLRYCAACHGPEGLGNGWNAPFLPVKPTMHANANEMSTRPDDTLFDGIYAGGYILGKSPFMPAFGQSLAPNEIRDLVGYIRTLCQCRQPAWAADNASIAVSPKARSSP
jgi:mono/diheme cytochrome c family protein